MERTVTETIDDLRAAKTVEPVFGDHQISRLVRLFRNFVGSAEFEQKRLSVERALSTSRPIFKKYWVEPTNWLWEGISAGAALIGSNKARRPPVTPIIHRALEFAEMIRLLHHDMPDWKKEDVRARLVGDELVTPLQTELLAAVHYQGIPGCQALWQKPQNTRTFDLLVKYRSYEFEIECKTKLIDAGRMIWRRHFYHFCDALADLVLPNIRVVEMVVPNHFPSNTNELLSAIKRAIKNGRATCPDSTVVSTELFLDSKEPVDIRAEIARAEELRGRHGHVAFVCDHGKPLTIICRSQRDDDLISAVEKDLVRALRQLSGMRPASIVCYIPELGDFAELKVPNTALGLMTTRFFQKKSAKKVYCVDYVTDPLIHPEAYGLRSEVRRLSFKNPSFCP